MDCLDRTNLGMLAIGQEALRRQLILLGCPLSRPSPSLNSESNPQSNSPFVSSDNLWNTFLPVDVLVQLTELWGSVGDEIAIAYAGSPAMHRAEIVPDVIESGFKANCCNGRSEEEEEINVKKSSFIMGQPGDDNDLFIGPLNGVIKKCWGSNPISPSPPPPSYALEELISNSYDSMRHPIFSEILAVSGSPADQCRWKAMKRSNASIAFQRYIHNVFGDLDRQRALDLLLGKFRPSIGTPSIWEVELFPNADSISNEVCI